MPKLGSVYPEIKRDYEELYSNSPVATYTCDADGLLTSYNLAAVELWGREPIIGKDYWCGSWKIYFTDGKPMPLDACPLALTLKKGVPFFGEEIVIERPDHEFRNVVVFPRPVFDDAGVLTGAHNTLVDISAYKKGEEKQGRLSAIVESSDDAIVSKNLDGIIKSWNAGAERIFGYSEEEIVGKSINMLIPPYMQDEEKIILQKIRSGRKVDHFQTIRLAKSGREVHVSITVSPVKDSRGHIIGASKIARDISEQLEKEELIRKNAKMLEKLNSIGRAISEKLDAKAILQKVTDETTQITGAVFGAGFCTLIDERGESYMLYTFSGAHNEITEKPGLPANIEFFRAAYKNGDIVRTDDFTKDPRFEKNAVQFGMPKGQDPMASYLAIPIISKMGELIGGLFFGHPQPGVFKEDLEKILISVASQASAALDNSRLFDEVNALNIKKDQFIALASHELKTPLTTIKGYLQILQKIEKEKTNIYFLEKSLRQVDKLNALISDLFDISRIQAGKLLLDYETFDLNNLVAEVVEIFQHNPGTHKIVLKTENDKCLVSADKQKIEQVLLNLLTNAIKYSPGADIVAITTSCTDKKATVKIRDKGIGLDAEQQKNIFDLFYRVEGNINVSGLGLGLYLSKEIIDRHSGNISVESEPRKGSVFSFDIPLKKPDR